MMNGRKAGVFSVALRLTLILICLATSSGYVGAGYAADAPIPLLKKGQPVDWWFVFKLNSKQFPECGGSTERVCLFGGDVQEYRFYSQQFVYASSADPALRQGSGCAGDSVNDPVGASFDQVYNGSYFYVIWNDQFYDDPEIEGCTTSCSSPWGHSKGMLSWNDAGEGFVLQVTTP
ncbi:MAG TPA: deoxyribonuclease II family protein, partial [Gemmataceae bacterium]|nr:deoxyribonuclease II family protein [Gemmataceae bacterium]